MGFVRLTESPLLTKTVDDAAVDSAPELEADGHGDASSVGGEAIGV